MASNAAYEKFDPGLGETLGVAGRDDQWPFTSLKLSIDADLGATSRAVHERLLPCALIPAWGQTN